MNPLILADSLTWGQYAGEVDRVAKYTYENLPCQWQPVTGEYRSINGDTSAYSVEAIVATPDVKAGDTIAHAEGTYEVVKVDNIYFRGRFHHAEVLAK